ncbi:glycosyltransferase family 4 protein [uncultured Chitinophaga sp.]|jgi:Glycosyltransferase|uniref:glycosyltransferase family 4 protein n=1 Tax=uncultured Chitinophaga sp. TaxID=339340 RepID=UPI00262678B1|nr:glycosyltransferase family 4 protein [uncultured Chitinophaga sp.]
MQYCNERKLKLVVLSRVVQHYRAPVYEKLSLTGQANLKVIYGPDFEGTKVVSTSAKFAFPKERIRSVRIRSRTINNAVLMPFSPFLFFKLIREKPQVILSEGASNLLNALQGFVYAKLFRKKFIWWSLGKLQHTEFDVKRKRINFLINWIERKSDAILTYSSVGRKYFEQIGVPPENIFVAVNVVDTDRLFEKISQYNREEVYREFHRDADFNILYVGGLDKGKRVDVLIKAYAALYKKYGSKVALHIVGKGDLRDELQDLAVTLGCHNVHFHGQVVDGVTKYFLGADVFVLPGLGGLAISEAMAHGLPVIVSIGDGCEVDLVDQENGIRDPYLNEQSLYKYLDELYANPALLNSMKAASVEKVRKRFNIRQYLLTVQNAINHVVHN